MYALALCSTFLYYFGSPENAYVCLAQGDIKVYCVKTFVERQNLVLK